MTANGTGIGQWPNFYFRHWFHPRNSRSVHHKKVHVRIQRCGCVGTRQQQQRWSLQSREWEVELFEQDSNKSCAVSQNLVWISQGIKISRQSRQVSCSRVCPAPSKDCSAASAFYVFLLLFLGAESCSCSDRYQLAPASMSWKMIQIS